MNAVVEGTTIRRAALVSALDRLKAVVARRTTAPALSHVLLESRAGVLRLHATNQDVWATVSAGKQEGETLSLLVNHAQMAGFLALVPSETVELAAMPNMGLRISWGRNRSAVCATLPEEDYAHPAPNQNEARVGVLPASELRRMLSTVHYASGTDISKPALGCVFLGQEYGRLFAVATSGVILAYRDSTEPCEVEKWAGVSIPQPAVAGLVGLLPDDDTEAELYASADDSGSFLRIAVGEDEAKVRLVASSYPFPIAGARQMMNQTAIPRADFTVSREAALRSARMASRAFEIQGACRTTLSAGDGELRFRVEGFGYAATPFNESIPAEVATPAEPRDFNASQLVRTFSALECVEVRVRWIPSALAVSPAGNDSELHIVAQLNPGK